MFEETQVLDCGFGSTQARTSHRGLETNWRREVGGEEEKRVKVSELREQEFGTIKRFVFSGSKELCRGFEG